MKRPVSMNTLMKVLRINKLNTDDVMRNHLLSYGVLILESRFHDV